MSFPIPSSTNHRFSIRDMIASYTKADSSTPTPQSCTSNDKGLFERLFDYFKGESRKQDPDKEEVAMCQRCPLKKKTRCCNPPKLIVRKKTSACIKCGVGSKSGRKKQTKWALDERPDCDLQIPVKCVTRRAQRSGKSMDIWVDGIKCAMPVEVVKCG